MKSLERLLCRYLRWRGWIVFWLDEQARHCGPNESDGCWLRCYLNSEHRGDWNIE